MVRLGPRGPEMNREEGRLLASAHEILRGRYGLLSCAPWLKRSEMRRSPLQMVGHESLGLRKVAERFRRDEMGMPTKSMIGCL